MHNAEETIIDRTIQSRIEQDATGDFPEVFVDDMPETERMTVIRVPTLDPHVCSATAVTSLLCRIQDAQCELEESHSHWLHIGCPQYDPIIIDVARARKLLTGLYTELGRVAAGFIESSPEIPLVLQ